MNPKQFLQIGGVIFLFLGIVGFLLPMTLGDMPSLDQPWNITHTLLGIIALILAPLPIGEIKKWIVVVIGLLLLFFGIMAVVAGTATTNFFGYTKFWPQDILHIALGIWALYAAFNRKAL